MNSIVKKISHVGQVKYDYVFYKDRNLAEFTQTAEFVSEYCKKHLVSSACITLMIINSEGIGKEKLFYIPLPNSEICLKQGNKTMYIKSISKNNVHIDGLKITVFLKKSLLSIDEQISSPKKVEHWPKRRSKNREWNKQVDARMKMFCSLASMGVAAGALVYYTDICRH